MEAISYFLTSLYHGTCKFKYINSEWSWQHLKHAMSIDQRWLLQYHTWVWSDKNNSDEGSHVWYFTDNAGYRFLLAKHYTHSSVQISQHCFHFECDRLPHSIKGQGNIIEVENKSTAKGLDLCKWPEIWAPYESKVFQNERMQLLLIKCASSKPPPKVRVDGESKHRGKCVWFNMCLRLA